MKRRERRDSGHHDLLGSRLEAILDMDHAVVKLAREVQRLGIIPPFFAPPRSHTFPAVQRRSCLRRQDRRHLIRLQFWRVLANLYFMTAPAGVTALNSDALDVGIIELIASRDHLLDVDDIGLFHCSLSLRRPNQPQRGAGAPSRSSFRYFDAQIIKAMSSSDDYQIRGDCRNENKVIPLASVSPPIVEAIAEGSAPADLMVTLLTRALPRSRTKHETRFGSFRARRTHGQPPGRGARQRCLLVDCAGPTHVANVQFEVELHELIFQRGISRRFVKIIHSARIRFGRRSQYDPSRKSAQSGSK